MTELCPVITNSKQAYLDKIEIVDTLVFSDENVVEMLEDIQNKLTEKDKLIMGKDNTINQLKEELKKLKNNQASFKDNDPNPSIKSIKKQMEILRNNIITFFFKKKACDPILEIENMRAQMQMIFYSNRNIKNTKISANMPFYNNRNIK